MKRSVTVISIRLLVLSFALILTGGVFGAVCRTFSLDVDGLFLGAVPYSVNLIKTNVTMYRWAGTPVGLGTRLGPQSKAPYVMRIRALTQPILMVIRPRRTAHALYQGRIGA